MAKITAHFNSTEFDCNDGTVYPVAWRAERLKPLCKALEVLRAELGGKPIRVHSGYRPPAYNRRIKGARRSQHMQGTAADIVVVGVPAEQVHRVILALIRDNKIPNGGVGKYRTFTHYDQRARAARWRGSRTRN